MWISKTDLRSVAWSNGRFDGIGGIAAMSLPQLRMNAASVT
ncbi:hypothetical protein BC777_0468 [Yoonia maricola]|uniref:Uncharacterized protein n=1 Tax=Yoonia maricola TaxID=420999 RepID=A0A2M8WL82_9RHOB|nr:hypothetical protein BC777_0468 [Yoonia maricola]